MGFILLLMQSIISFNQNAVIRLHLDLNINDLVVFAVLEDLMNEAMTSDSFEFCGIKFYNVTVESLLMHCHLFKNMKIADFERCFDKLIESGLINRIPGGSYFCFGENYGEYLKDRR